MAITRQRPIDDVKQVNVSQASREDARPPSAKFASYCDEWDSLVSDKQTIQHQLTLIGRDFGKHHAAIRAKDLPEAESYAAWMRIKGPMEKKQVELTAKLHAIEDRMREIKPHVRREKQAEQRQESQSDGIGMMRNDLLNAILDELKTIHATLKAMKADKP
jgi:small-conductance mechanosensitive channel